MDSAERSCYAHAMVSDGLQVERARERRILFFTCSAHALVHAYMLVYSAVREPMRQSFGLELDDFLAYASLSNIFFGLGAVPSGLLSDRLGEKTLLVACFLVSGIGSLIVAAATAPWALGLGMIVMGAGVSIYHPVGLSLISKGFAQPGRAMGVNGFWGSAGTALGPIVAVQCAGLAIFASWFGEAEAWRSSYLVLAVPSIFIGLCLMRSDIRARDEARRGDGDADSNSASAGKPAASSAPIVVFAVLLLAMTCGGFYFHLITAALPKYCESNVSFFQG
ncbi:MAG: MFS transporter, partial [Planctomycetota bacterium]